MTMTCSLFFSFQLPGLCGSGAYVFSSGNRNSRRDLGEVVSAWITKSVSMQGQSRETPPFWEIKSIVCRNGWTPQAALDISTGPLARRTFQTAGPVRASTFHLSLAHTGHLDICRASRFQIVLARTMTNHSMYFSRGSPPHISAVFAQSFCYSETPAWRESESGVSIKHTDVSV